MSPGRHRQSPPLHRLLAPVAVVVVALACAGAAWAVGEPGVGDTDTVVLRGCAAGAALAAVVGGALLRSWDRAAGRRVAELQARQTGAEWRAEEKQAELEEQLEDERKLRDRLEGKISDQHGEVARLRNEHAALLRRYAHAETERARALEQRRRLEAETGGQKALPASAADHRGPSGAPTPLTYLQASEALRTFHRNGARQRAERAERERRERAREELRRAEQEGRERAQRERAARERAARDRQAGTQAAGFDFFGAHPRRVRRRPPDGPARPELPPQAGGPGAAGGRDARSGRPDDGRGGPDARGGHGPAGPGAGAGPGNGNGSGSGSGKGAGLGSGEQAGPPSGTDGASSASSAGGVPSAPEEAGGTGPSGTQEGLPERGGRSGRPGRGPGGQGPGELRSAS